MRLPLVRVIVVGILVGGTTLAYAFSSGPPAARTGAPAFGGRPAENSCGFGTCHNTFAVNSGPGTIEILDAPETYDLSHSYTIRVRVSHPQPDEVAAPKWGFEIMAARADSGTGVGTFLLPPPGPAPGYPDSLKFATSVTHPTRQYVTHTFGSTRTGNRTSAEWQVTWVAPAVPAGRIYFFAAGNAANGDGGSGDDYIYTASDSMDVGNTAVPIAQLAAGNRLGAPHPNPSGGPVELRYSVARPGVADLSIFDLNGRRIRSVVHGRVEAGSARARWDGRGPGGEPVPAGVYFARLQAGGQTITRRIMIAH